MNESDYSCMFLLSAEGMLDETDSLSDGVWSERLCKGPVKY